MELLRRLLLIFFTVAAISTLMAPAPVLYLVERPDFARELKRHPFLWEHKGQTITQYMEEETRDSILTLSAKSWQAVSETLRSQPHGFLEVATPAIKDIVDLMNSSHPARYLQKEGAPAGEFLRIRKISPDSYSFKDAPFFYQHPYAPWSILFCITGLLFYIFLPRRRFTEDTLCYGIGFSAVIGPDVVALMIVSGFFTLGLGVGLSAAPGGLSTIFSSNLIIPTIILWAFTLFGLYIFKIAARYAGLGLQCSAGQLILYSPAGTEKIFTRDVECVQLGYWQASKWVTRFGLLISLFNWRAAGPVLLNASRNDPQLELHLKDGRKLIYDLNAAQNVEQVFSCLEKNGVKIDSALRALVSPH
jgi:hypothetical protein